MKKPARKFVSNSAVSRTVSTSVSAASDGPHAPVQRGHLVRVLTPDELHEDMKAFGQRLARDKHAAIAFLQAAGILNRQGKLAKGYRS